MASIMDRGDSYHVIYLGSCMMAHMATGLGVLQKPLRDLYFKYRQAGGGPAAQERYITMSPRGMTMTYRDSSSAQPTELFYSMPSILFWDAVQFITVRGGSGDKKVRGAFEPLDNDHSRNKDNLFSILEKKFNFLQQMTHPPLFTCVLRRTSGVKALDVHAFVCSSDEEAISLVNALNTVQQHYKSDEVQETGVFGYKPFGSHGDSQVDSLRRNGVGGGSMDRASLGAGPRVLPPSGLGLSQLAHTGGRESMTAPHKSQSALALSSHQQQLLSPSQADYPRQHRGVHQPRVYQLTQQDFQPTRSELDLRGIQEDQVGPIEADQEEEDTYAYLTHIDNKKHQRESSTPTPPPRNVGVVGAQQRDQNHRGGHLNRHQQELEARLAEDSSRNRQSSAFLGQDWDGSSSLSSSPGTGSFNRPQPKPRASVAARQSKLGQGYSLLSGSGAPVPGQEEHSRSGDQAGFSTPPRPRPRSPRYPSGDRLQQGEGSRRMVYRDYDDNRDPDRNSPPRQVPVRPTVLSKSSQDLRSPDREVNRGLGSPFDSPRRGIRDDFPPRGSPTKNTPEPPPRPVAKVPPHKVTGVKVLPSEPLMLRKTSPESPSPGDRSKSSLPGAEDRMYASPQRKTKSHYYDEHNFRDGQVGEKGKSGKYKDNWQFKPPDQGSEYEYKTLSPEEKAGGKGGTSNMGEKLLLSKKKDAEIASVMQDLRFEYDGRTMSPGMPAGNNFEKSLGYFP